MVGGWWVVGVMGAGCWGAGWQPQSLWDNFDGDSLPESCRKRDDKFNWVRTGHARKI